MGGGFNDEYNLKGASCQETLQVYVARSLKINFHHRTKLKDKSYELVMTNNPRLFCDVSRRDL